MSEIRPITSDDLPALLDFIRGLPDGDRTFFKEQVSDDIVRRWCEPDDGGGRRWVLCEDGVIKGILALIPFSDWSSHVAELRLVVGAEHRRQGVGRRLARHGLTEGLRMDLGKLVVDVVADRQGDIEMFSKIGFHPEALLEAHIRDRDGRDHDMVVLAHQVQEQAGAMGAVGLEDAVDVGGAA
jgi:ribosomal protein S18 acetylase RimI-like enzyme